MNPFALSSLITATLSLVLSVFVYQRGRKLKLNKLWASTSLTVSFWSLGLFGVTFFKECNLAYTSQIILDVAGIFLPVFFANFVLNLVEKDHKYSKLSHYFYILAIFLSILSVTKYFKVGLKPIFEFRYWVEPGPLYIIFPLFFLILATFSVVILIKSRIKFSGIKNQQIKYVLYTAFIGFGGGAFNFLPQYSHIYPIGNYLVGFYVVAISYAMVKYRLMNIRFIVTRSILYAVLVSTVASFFALSVFVISNLIEDNNQIVTYLITSFVIVVFLDPLKKVLAKTTDRIFYKNKINYQNLLQEAGEIIAKEIDLKLLSEKLSKLLSHRLKIKEVNIFDNNFKKLASSEDYVFDVSDNLKSFLMVQTSIIITEELIRDIDSEKYDYDSKELNKIVDKLQGLNIEMLVPIMDEGKLISLLLLSDKQSGDLYNEEDINFFQVLVPQIASAFEKSKLYEELQRSNIRLEKQVNERTKSLQEANEKLEDRNKFLTTMQVVTNMISRTLDLEQIMQMIADSISKELGYVGGILSFVDEDRNFLRVGAITESEEIKAILGTLPDDPKSYKAELKKGYNLGVDTVLQGKISYSEELSDFLSPPADEEIMGVVQEALNIKTIVGVPIYSEDKIIGLIHFLLPFAREKVSAFDEEIMTAMTNQVGILSRNLQLYDNLQGTNKELQEANVHLKALDKAKSEFVSIASHQLRTPISAIKGYLSMLIEGDFGEISEDVKKVVNGLFESSSRLARLVNTFLNVSRIESGRLKLEIKPTQVNDLIKGVIGELGNEAEQKGLKLTYQENENLPMAMADSDKLREVILNLIDNSIKYTPKGSVDVSVVTDDEKFTFQVKDTGIGIDPEEAKGLFRKFVRGSGVAQIHTGGSGLGLFIAQRIIKEHGGMIWAESEGKEKGSAFKFEVPIAK